MTWPGASSDLTLEPIVGILNPSDGHVAPARRFWEQLKLQI